MRRGPLQFLFGTSLMFKKTATTFPSTYSCLDPMWYCHKGQDCINTQSSGSLFYSITVSRSPLTVYLATVPWLSSPLQQVINLSCLFVCVYSLSFSLSLLYPKTPKKGDLFVCLLFSFFFKYCNGDMKSPGEGCNSSNYLICCNRTIFSTYLRRHMASTDGKGKVSQKNKTIRIDFSGLSW